MIGCALSLRSFATSSRMRGSVVPAASARAAERWRTGPSAIGSENGTPSSIASAPSASAARTRSCVVGRSGPRGGGGGGGGGPGGGGGEGGGAGARPRPPPARARGEMVFVAAPPPPPPRRERSRVRARLEPAPRRLDADQLDAPVAAEGVEEPQGVAPAAHARDARVGQPPAGAQHLAAGLVADPGLGLAHHERVGGPAGDPAGPLERGGA